MKKIKLNDDTPIYCLKETEAIVLDEHIQGYLNLGIDIQKDFTIIALGRKTSLNKLHTELKPDINSRAFSSSSVSSIQKQFGISKKQMSVVSSKNPLEDILVERAAILF